MSSQRDVNRPRPNPLHPYQCGFRDIGAGCLTGPTADGQCCQIPSGGCDKADCGSDCDHCGKCQVAHHKRACPENRENYKACIPIRTHWYWRNMLALNLAILASGILLVCMSLPNHESLFVPGQLSRSHSQILENTLVSDRCSLCHTTAHGNTIGQTQEQLCMNCHKSHMPDAALSNPHDLNLHQFKALVSFHPVSEDRSTAEPQLTITRCAQCHIEHHADDQDLKSITNERCQACHQKQFSSFSTNHPEFRSFPYENIRRIAFDHVAHFEKYFAQKNASFDCKLCHEVAAESPSSIRRTASFDQACASCHDQPLKASTADGWAILQLPSLNSSDLMAGGELLANWPPTNLYGYDGKISLPMRLLLSSDAATAEALKNFGQGDLSQVRPGDQQQQAAARTVAQAVRTLLRETAKNGQEAWRQRLTAVASQALNREPTEAEAQLIGTMLAGLPPDLFRQMESNWFGNPKAVVDRTNHRVSATLVATQDLLGSDDQSPQGESAEDLLRGSSTQGLDYQNQKRAPKNLANPATPSSSSSSVSAPGQSKPEKSSDILSTEEDSLSDEELLKLPSSSAGKPGVQSKLNDGPAAGKTAKLTATKLLGEGGWYLDSQLFTLKYMPSGHADPVVAAWIQFSALVDSTRPQFDQGAPNDTQILQPWHTANWKPGNEAVGGCTECHLLPVYSASKLSQKDWRADEGAKAKPFTKFSHTPHMALPATSDCSHCHQFNRSLVERYVSLTKSMGANQSRADHYKTSQQHFQCEFKAMEKSQCNACHRAGGASEGCTQCHNYHIGTSGFEAMLQGNVRAVGQSGTHVSNH